jgi:hypothetical protein
LENKCEQGTQSSSVASSSNLQNCGGYGQIALRQLRSKWITSKILPTVNYVHDAHAWATNPVENYVFPNRKAAIARPQLIASTPSLRIVAE